jgi:hypothetical protein
VGLPPHARPAGHVHSSLCSAGFGGTNTLHEAFSGCTCDLCGKEADSETAEVVAMDCSFKSCPAESCLYHQACLEKYLKSIKCESKCPANASRGRACTSRGSMPG